MWAAETRVPLREAIRQTRWSGLAGSIRILEYGRRYSYVFGETPGAAPMPADRRTMSVLHRATVREWAGRTLRELGAQRLQVDDRLDSIYMLSKKVKQE